MQREQLQAIQGPIKRRYQENPEAALVTLSASGKLDGENIVCSVATGRALVDAGLHPSTGGDGVQVCSGDMLLQALVACAGVTLRAVATSLEIPVTGTVHAEGEIDMRGTSAWTRRHRWDSRRSGSASTWRATRLTRRSPLSSG